MTSHAALRDRLDALHPDMTAWRRDFHAHPEIGYEEHRTSEIVATRLAEWGIEVHRGLGGTGVVGVLRGRRSGAGGNRAIGLRADMDALPMQEGNGGVAHRSTIPGRMHACGHDGHTAMLLGAAKVLAETRDFAGTVHLIFQPAEEGLAGAKAMRDDGLFEKFPCDAVYGIHNDPFVDLGQVMVHKGTALAAIDYFSVVVRGRSSHGAQPHRGIDSVSVAAQVVNVLQALVARHIDPLETAIVSIGQIHGGTSDIVIPETVELRGSVRTLKPEIRDRVEALFADAVRHTAAAQGATAEIAYRRAYPATVNTPEETERAARCAAAVLGGEAALIRDAPPLTAGEDFAFFLERVPGAYLLFGQRGAERGGVPVHNPEYDFNDDLLPIGAAYLAGMVQQELG
ncbi:M20 family metallopeptidase [Roseomonas sp. OT10]|uniref:M20 aminoacylase family protein n=1 Tax=Roseomonas cutis TaxID=2897332 RepID=UPI001E28E240|nr:M20 aminoacylase family protein [Roseomonas sp. OT10]UFN51215.1 M20 family metallopeptidase [Roseomonas sp. OT10]